MRLDSWRVGGEQGEEPCARNQQTIYSSFFKKYEEVQSLKLFEQNGYKGGVKASRNNPKCYSKQNQKEIQSGKKTSFLRKHLSLESSYNSLDMSKNLINLLKVGALGDISTQS